MEDPAEQRAADNAAIRDDGDYQNPQTGADVFAGGKVATTDGVMIDFSTTVKLPASSAADESGSGENLDVVAIELPSSTKHLHNEDAGASEVIARFSAYAFLPQILVWPLFIAIPLSEPTLGFEASQLGWIIHMLIGFTWIFYLFPLGILNILTPEDSPLITSNIPGGIATIVQTCAVCLPYALNMNGLFVPLYNWITGVPIWTAGASVLVFLWYRKEHPPSKTLGSKRQSWIDLAKIVVFVSCFAATALFLVCFLIVFVVFAGRNQPAWKQMLVGPMLGVSTLGMRIAVPTILFDIVKVPLAPQLRAFFGKRIRINGQLLQASTFQEYFWSCFDRLTDTKHLSGEFAPMPGYFRFLTILAFDIFTKENLDVVVLEVGVGGRLDPTNVIPAPVAAAITSIGLDHTETLGSSLAKIAAEKAGIIKNGSIVFTIEQDPSVIDVLRSKCELEQTSLSVVPALPASIKLGLEGDHQRQNAALAVALSRTWLAYHGIEACSSITDLSDRILSGLAQCSWPGRCQVIQVSPNLRFFLDGAHTVESMFACARWFYNRVDRNSSLALLFNCSHTRDPFSIMQPLVSAEQSTNHAFELVMSCPFDEDRPHLLDAPSLSTLCGRAGRSASVEAELEAGSDMRAQTVIPSRQRSWQETQLQVWDLLSEGRTAQSAIADSIDDAVARLRQWSARRPNVHSDVLVCGSLYLVGGILRSLSDNNIASQQS